MNKNRLMNSLVRNILIIILAIISFACDKEDNEIAQEDTNFQWPELYNNNISTKQISTNNDGWDFHPKWSNSGDKICFARYIQSTSKLVVYIYSVEDGTITPIIENMTGDFSTSWSPDDTKIAFDARDDSDISQIYILDLTTGETKKFTDDNSNSFRPDWSNDGKIIVYCTNNSICYKQTDGDEVTYISETQYGSNPTWNFDDSKILFVKSTQNEDLYSINPDGTELTLLAKGNSVGSENWGSWSPDGNRIVYQLFNSNNPKIVVKDLANDNDYLLTDMDNSRFPDWSPDGNSFVYACGDNLWISAIEEK